jgi:hypothetical protein
MGTCRLHFQGRRINQAKNQHEADRKHSKIALLATRFTPCSSETSVSRTTRRYIPGVTILHNHRCDNLKYYKRKRPLTSNTLMVDAEVNLPLNLTNKTLHHEYVSGNGCTDPRILDLGTSWRSDSRSCRFITGERALRCPLDRRLGGPQNRYGRYGKQKDLSTIGTRTPTPRPCSNLVISLPARLLVQHCYSSLWLRMIQNKNLGRDDCPRRVKRAIGLNLEDTAMRRLSFITSTDVTFQEASDNRNVCPLSGQKTAMWWKHNDTAMRSASV